MDRLEEYSIECMMIHDNQLREDELIKEYESKSMDRLISEEKWEHISKLSEIRSKYSCFEDDEKPYYKALSEGIKALKAVSSAEPTYYPPCEDCHTKMNEIRKAYDKLKKPKTGHWINKYHEVFKYYCCDKCGTGNDLRTNYCPNCGAKMIEPQERRGEE